MFMMSELAAFQRQASCTHTDSELAVHVDVCSVVTSSQPEQKDLSDWVQFAFYFHVLSGEVFREACHRDLKFTSAQRS